MNRRIVFHLVVITALILTAGAWTQAQAQAQTVNIGSRFVVGSKTFDAGNYSVDLTSAGAIVLTPEKGGAPIEFPNAKKISRPMGKQTEVTVALVGSVWFLNEVLIPGKGAFEVAKMDEPDGRKTFGAPKAK